MSRRVAVAICFSLLLLPSACEVASDEPLPPPPAGGPENAAASPAATTTVPTATQKQSEVGTPPPLPSKWSSHARGLPFVLGFHKGLARSKATGKPVMFFVTATWCGWCKKLAAESFTDPAIKKLLESFVLVIVDGDRERSESKYLGARGFPHVVFQSSSGKTLEICQGYKPKGFFKRIVERALATQKRG